MKIRVGDSVKFLNEVGEGVVVSIIGKNMVNVETSDGFEMPMMVSQLVVENPVATREQRADAPDYDTVEESDSTVDYLDEIIDIKGFVEVNVTDDKDEFELMFGIVPNDIKDPIQGGMNAYLINNSNFTVLFQYAHDSRSGVETIECGVLEPNMRIELEKWKSNNLQSVSSLLFSIIPFRKRMEKLQEPAVIRYDFNPVKLFKGNAFVENDFFRKEAMLVSLVKSDESQNLIAAMEQISTKEIRKSIRDKDVTVKSKSTELPKLASKTIREVDLHIDELIDTTAGLSNREMLDIQLSAFRKEIEQAIKDKVKRIVFIHGRGNGVLKSAVAKELQHKYKKYQSQDASFQQYGYGATLVILQR